MVECHRPVHGRVTSPLELEQCTARAPGPAPDGRVCRPPMNHDTAKTVSYCLAALVLVGLGLFALRYSLRALRADHWVYLTMSAQGTEVSGRMDHRDPNLLTHRRIIMESALGQVGVRLGAGGEFSSLLGEPSVVVRVEIGENAFTVGSRPLPDSLLGKVTGIRYSEPFGVAVISRHWAHGAALLCYAVLTLATLGAAGRLVARRWTGVPAKDAVALT
jgi:hypothetical protein